MHLTVLPGSAGGMGSHVVTKKGDRGPPGAGLRRPKPKRQRKHRLPQVGPRRSS